MGRAPCCDKDGLKKGPWTPEEDEKLIDYIQKHGYGNWRTLPKNAGLQRCGKSCRLRWTNYLRPDIKRGRFSLEEEDTIIQLHSILGNKWSAIAARLPGRTDNEIKNYWNTHIRKRLLRMGIDPVTHSPRLDLLDLSSIFGSAFYNNFNSASQIDFTRQLIGLQQPPQVNPELIRLAAAFVTNSQRDQNQNFHAQSSQQNQLCVSQSQVQTQFQNNTMLQEVPTCTTLADNINPCFERITSNHELSNITNFAGQNSYDWQISNEMASNLSQDYVPALSCYNNSYYDDDTNNAQNFGFGSVLSTPSSSPTPLNSNSTTHNINSSCITTEDERESYCSSILNIPEILDVSNFM